MPRNRMRVKVTKKVSRFRSKFEKSIASSLRLDGIPFLYEPYPIKYIKPQTPHKYIPDFVLPNGIVIAAKGLFSSKDRQKHLLIQEQYPKLDIRFVFQRPFNRLYKGAKTTYAEWATKNGFKWAKKKVPKEWIMESFPEE